MACRPILGLALLLPACTQGPTREVGARFQIRGVTAILPLVEAGKKMDFEKGPGLEIAARAGQILNESEPGTAAVLDLPTVRMKLAPINGGEESEDEEEGTDDRPARMANLLGADSLIWGNLAAYETRRSQDFGFQRGRAVIELNIWTREDKVVRPVRFQEQFPPHSLGGAGIPLVELDEATIDLRLKQRAAQRIAWLFYDHEEPVLE